MLTPKIKTTPTVYFSSHVNYHGTKITFVNSCTNMHVLKLIFSDVFYFSSHNNIRIVRLCTCREAHLYRISFLCDPILVGMIQFSAHALQNSN